MRDERLALIVSSRLHCRGADSPACARPDVWPPGTPPVGGQMPTKRFFTEDVYVLRWQWRRVAEAIVAAKAQLKAAGLL